MIIGFTGTRKGLTLPQRHALRHALTVDWDDESSARRCLHGGANGADEEFHNIARKLPCSQVIAIEIYPCVESRRRYWLSLANETFYEGKDFLVREIDPPLVRNRIIARRCARLIACPVTDTEELRSGTWATVRYARQAGKPITLVMPDGSLVDEVAAASGETRR